MYKRKIPIALDCGLDLVREILNGKWKIMLLYYISKGIKRPGALQRSIPEASRRVLNMQLNQLEEHELISKLVYAELPPKVEYSLTEFGKSLIPVIEAIGDWGDNNRDRLQQVIVKAENLLFTADEEVVVRGHD
jgi:DNA-binding HxlR family transcriptional regulator